MSAVTEQPVIAACSFCLKPNTEVRRLVAGPGVFICDGCVALCGQLIDGPPPRLPSLRPGNMRSASTKRWRACPG